MNDVGVVVGRALPRGAAQPFVQEDEYGPCARKRVTCKLKKRESGHAIMSVDAMEQGLKDDSACLAGAEQVENSHPCRGAARQSGTETGKRVKHPVNVQSYLQVSCLTCTPLKKAEQFIRQRF